jgi:flagellar motor component MotA
MQYSVIHDEALLEKVIEDIRFRSLSLTESELTSKFKSTYDKQIFEPLYSYLEESFLSGLLKKGKDFANKFAKGAKEIATKVGTAIKEFSFKKIFATVTKMMRKIKQKVLQGLMNLLAPLREVILANGFCSEDNKFSPKKTFDKLVAVAKDAGKEIEADKILDDKVVNAIEKNANVEGIALAESFSPIFEDEAEEKEKGRATFDQKDVKYMDFFQKMLFKLGVKGTKLNGVIAEISKKIAQGAAITGVFTIIAALLPTAGIIAAIGGAVGAAIAAAPVLVMIIGAILFGIGLFMFATWLLQPYPTIENCRIFLSTIFSGAHPFDYPDAELGSIQTVPMDKAQQEKPKPAFDYELIADLEEEGVEEDIPSDTEQLKEEAGDIIKQYDDLDIDTLEDDKEVEDNKRIARIFVRNIFTQKGRDKVQTEIEKLKEDEEDNDYVKKLEDFLSLVDNIYRTEAVTEEDEDGKKLYPYALSYQKIQAFLKDKKNSVADRMTKVIDVTDNFIDRIDKINKKD